jgi:hypothetical protein
MSFAITMSEIFGYAEDIVNSMLPVAYVAGGVGLGFVVISKIISAFR